MREADKKQINSISSDSTSLRLTIRFKRAEDRELIKRAAELAGLSEAALVKSILFPAVRKMLKESEE
jgi:uncharacterized protein (DUF1778 family)